MKLLFNLQQILKNHIQRLRRQVSIKKIIQNKQDNEKRKLCDASTIKVNQLKQRKYLKLLHASCLLKFYILKQFNDLNFFMQ